MDTEELATRVWFPTLVDALHEHGVRPNQITAAGLGCSLLAAGLIVTATWAPYALSAGAVFVALALLADALDGDLARVHDLQSDTGAFFDFTSDKVSDILVYGALTAVCSVPLAGFAAITGDLLISGMSAKSEALSGTYVKSGIGGRGGGHVAITLGVVATPVVAPATAYSVPDLLTGVLLVVAVLKYATVVDRLRVIYPELGADRPESTDRSNDE